MTDRPILTLPPPDFMTSPELRRLFSVLTDARVVGGAVRDALLGRTVSDVDLATPRPPQDVQDELRAAGVRTIPTGLAHGTVTAVLGVRTFEITSLRRDVSTDGRHAVVAFTNDWREDAARRDFTMNALSMAPSGELFDYFGGLDDLRVGRVRFVGEPAQRIVEDYLRILRFIRFHARYGRIPPDAAEAEAIRNAAPQLARLSSERIWNELRLVLEGPNSGAAIELMEELGVLSVLLPEAANDSRFRNALAVGAPSDAVFRLAALLPDRALAEPIADRLKLSAEERGRLISLLSPPVPEPNLDDGALRRLLADETPEMLLARTWLSGGNTARWFALRARLANLPRPQFPLAGRDVVAAGIPEGPRVGKLLGQVRAWWLDEGCLPDAPACRERLRQLISADCKRHSPAP